MNAMVGNYKFFYAGYLTIKLLAKFHDFPPLHIIIYNIYKYIYKIFILEFEAEGISTLTTLSTHFSSSFFNCQISEID